MFSKSPVLALLIEALVSINARDILFHINERTYRTSNASTFTDFHPPKDTTNSTFQGHNSSSVEFETSKSSIPAQPVLLPTVHWNHDVGDIRNLAPQSSQDFYYSVGGVSGKRSMITSVQSNVLNSPDRPVWSSDGRFLVFLFLNRQVCAGNQCQPCMLGTYVFSSPPFRI